MREAEHFIHVKIVAQKFTVLSHYKRSFHAVGDPFYADSRSDSLAQNFCAESGALQHTEVNKQGFPFVKVATQIKFGLIGPCNRNEFTSASGG